MTVYTNDVWDAVVRAIGNIRDFREEITPTTMLGEFRMDSLDIVELAMEIEEELDISIPIGEWENSGMSDSSTMLELVVRVESWFYSQPPPPPPPDPNPRLRMPPYMRIEYKLPWQEVGF